VAAALHHIPDVGSIAQTTLLRGYAFRVPSGQCVAQAFEEEVLSGTALQGESVSIGAVCDPECPGPVAGSRLLLERTPLWFYVLKEADLKRNGNGLGPVGGRLIAEVVVGLLRADASSIFHQPTWRPDWGVKLGEFSMADLLRIARLDEPPA
jgi:hypothetical protein